MSTRDALWRVAMGGVAGTLMMTALMYGVAPIMGLSMDIAAMLGAMFGGSWIAGMMLHIVNGSVIFPSIYALTLACRLPGPPALRGAIWGLILWLISQTIVMPMMGGGLFSSAMGGISAAMASLMGHAVYGGAFGLVAGQAHVCPARD